MIVDYSRKLYHQDARGDLYVVEFIPTDVNVYVKIEINHTSKDAIAFSHEEAREQWIRLWNRGYRHNLMLLNFAVGA
jgi:hypothetical protein